MIKTLYVNKELFVLDNCNVAAPPNVINVIMVCLADYFRGKSIQPVPITEPKVGAAIHFAPMDWVAEPEFEFTVGSDLSEFVNDLQSSQCKNVQSKLRGLFCREDVAVTIMGQVIEVEPPLKAPDSEQLNAPLVYFGRLRLTHWNSNRIEVAGFRGTIFAKDGVCNLAGGITYRMELKSNKNNRGKVWFELMAAEPVAANDNYSLDC